VTRRETLEEIAVQGHPPHACGFFGEVADASEAQWLADEMRLSAANFIREARRSLDDLESARGRMSTAEFSAIAVSLRAQIARESRRLRLCLAMLTRFAEDGDLVSELRGCLRLVAGVWGARARFRVQGWLPAMTGCAQCQILWVVFQCLSLVAEHGAPSLQLEVLGQPTGVNILIRGRRMQNNGANGDILGAIAGVLKERMYALGGSVRRESEDGCVIVLDFVKPKEGSAWPDGFAY